MKNPFGDQQVPGSYQNLRERVYKRVSAQVHDPLRRLMVQAYEQALQEENVVLSRPERNRLFTQVLGRIFDDIARSDGSLAR